VAPVQAQTYQGGMFIPAPFEVERPKPQQQLPQKIHKHRDNEPATGETLYRADYEERAGSVYILRGNAEVEKPECLLKADEIHYDEDSGLAEARGNVHYINFDSQDELFADRADYDMVAERGTFYVVSGSAPGHAVQRLGLLTTTEPIRFKGDWAERIEDRYILYQGTLTNCPPGTSWWQLISKRMVIYPDDHALAYKALLRLHGIPVFWAPAFYKSLDKEDRRSGFLTPNIGNSSTRGQMIGVGFFWAINRSYQMMYRPQYYTVRGFAHTVDFAGRPNEHTKFNAYFYGVDDKGLPEPGGTRLKQGGYMASVSGQADQLGDGWYARGIVNYLSSYTFRQAFTESFNEAVFSEVNSLVYAGKDWKSYDLAVFGENQQNFNSTTPGDEITIRHLPEVSLRDRDTEIVDGPIPLWFSFNATGGLLSREEPLFQTRPFVDRLDFRPRLSTSFHWKGIDILPSFALEETSYGEGMQNNNVVAQRYLRSSREFDLDVIFPSLYRIYNAPKWMGSKLKHSIEPRFEFKNISGVNDFNRVMLFDESDLVADTTQASASIVNRLWTKTASGEVRDFVSWEVGAEHYFDPTFGGAAVQGIRDIVESTSEFGAYTFMQGPRGWSPLSSALRVQPLSHVGFEWRTDYDPLRRMVIDSSVTADSRFDNIFFSVGSMQVGCMLYQPLSYYGINPCLGAPTPTQALSPPSNQFRGLVGFGRADKRGWNAAFLGVYDYRVGLLDYGNVQVTYNAGCCAFNVQFRRWNFGTRDEKEYKFSFVIANIGSVGSLRRQDRLF
jgi:LPS-assembly protein